MSVKNLLEFKMGVNVLIDSNLFQNCWVGADQTAEAIAINGLDQYGADPWQVVSNFTVTNNVIQNTGEGIAVDTDAYNTGTTYSTLPRMIFSSATILWKTSGRATPTAPASESKSE